MESGFFASFFETDSRLEVLRSMTDLGRRWGWVLFAGLVLVILGGIAFALPVASTVGLTIGLAALLIVSGIVHFIQAFQLRHEPGSTLRFFQSFLALLIGALIFRYPEGGLLAIALALSFQFFMSAIVQWNLAWTMRPFPGRFWSVLGGFASFALGVYIVATFPFSALWVPGTLLGIDLLVTGGSLIGFSMSLRQLDHRLHGTAPSKRTSSGAGKSAFRPSSQPT